MGAGRTLDQEGALNGPEDPSRGQGWRFKLMSKARAAIDRIKELRTALISAAVTGRIDVRIA